MKKLWKIYEFVVKKAPFTSGVLVAYIIVWFITHLYHLVRFVF